MLWLSSVGCSTASPLSPDTQDTQDTPEDTAVAPVSLIDNTAWAVVPPEEDPFWPEASEPENVCLPEDYGPEEQPDGIWFEVKTEDCAYLTVTQTLLHDIEAGTSINFRLWHFSVTIGSTDYRLAISLGPDSDIFWEAQVPVPSDSHLFYGTIEAEKSYPAGSPVYFHISNHGSNDWGLIEFSKVL